MNSAGDNDRDAPIVVETADRVTAAVIWLHGLGADGNDFAGIVPELGLPSSLGVRFVFPHAPFRPVTLNNGYVMRAWYDLAWSERGFWQESAHIEESVQAIHRLVDAERARGIPADRIVVGGFSQGGVMTLHAALRYAERLAGATVLSAPAVKLEELFANASAANAALPVFVAHGRRDPIAPFALGAKIRDSLAAHGYPVEWHEYEMEHSVCIEEIDAIGAFLTRVLS